MSIKGLYSICDLSTRRGSSHTALAEQLLRGGAKIMQLRVKGSGEAIYRLRRQSARAIMKLKERYRFHFIINDDPLLVRELGADGVHVGADDTPIAYCRRLLGPTKLIGYSAHDIEEAVWAESEGADYVAFGAIYPSPSKGPHHPVQGLARLQTLSSRLEVPSVAIGGITYENVETVLKTGVYAVAMISALNKASNVVTATRLMVDRIESSIRLDKAN